jgi:ATP-dependent Clp endopeptidase proteolytic subunit ClpP
MFKILLATLLATIFSILPTEVKIDKPLQQPHIIYVSAITPKSAVKFAAEMDYAHSTGQQVIPIVISSYGGSVYSLLEMVDIIKSSKLPVATIATGKAMSAGAVLLSCGDEGLRFMGPNATIMMHEVSTMLGGTSQSIKMTAKEVQRLNTRLFHIIAENTGKPNNYFLDIIHRKGHADWYMDAKEAKTHNIVNHVGIPTLKTQIKIESYLRLNTAKKIDKRKK